MSFRTRLVLAAAYLVAAVVLALEIPLALSIERRADSDFQADVLSNTALLAARISDDVAAANQAGSNANAMAVANAVDETANGLGQRIVVTSANGRVLTDSADQAAPGSMFATPQRPEFHTIYVGLRGRGHLVVDFAPVPLGAGLLTFLAAGRVQQFVVDRSLDAWMLLVEPTLIAAGDASLRAPAVLSPAWVEPAIEIPRDEHRELVAIVELVAAEQARPVDTQQQGILVALLHALLHRAERHASRDATAARPSCQSGRCGPMCQRSCRCRGRPSKSAERRVRSRPEGVQSPRAGPRSARGTTPTARNG